MSPRRDDPIVAALLCACVGCGGDETAPPTPAPTTPPACVPPEVALPDGSCIRPGIPPDGCAEGFVHDSEYGCEPTLPAGPCPPGLMAVPGDVACRPVMPCGEGKWGDIPVDATTVYVDGSYAGGASDGSADMPWTTIGDAIAAAADGALVAIAEGTYAEDVVVASKTLRLWGVCPDRVEIVGSDTSAVCIPSAVCIMQGASGTEVRGLALRGDSIGLSLSGSTRVLVQGTWIHGNASRGVNVQDTLGDASLTLIDSLVEQNREYGVFVVGSDVRIETTVVRDTLPMVADSIRGRGIEARASCDVGTCEPTDQSNLTLVGSLVEQNHEMGLYVLGSQATIDASVVRRTLPGASAQPLGQGIRVEPLCVVAPNGSWACDQAVLANVVVTGSLVDQCHEYGILVDGSTASIERTVVRGTLPSVTDKTLGRGIEIETCDAQDGCDVTVRSNATLEASLVEKNHDIGLFVMGSDATIEAVVVRGTSPGASDQRAGIGISVQMQCSQAPDGMATCDHAVRGNALVRGSLIDENHQDGVLVSGSDATIETSVVRRTSPRASDQNFGRGISVVLACVAVNGEAACDPGARSTAALRRSLVEKNHDIGLIVLGSEASVESSVVRGTLARASDGLYGDGISVLSPRADVPGRLMVADTRIVDSARAGLSSFGALASLGGVTIECAAFDLESEPYGGVDSAFEDRGDNLCGCPTGEPAKASGPCVAVSAGLEPPEPTGVLE